MQTGKLRIIGGKWRGRKLHFPAIPHLRPTPDRVRETLFNWLMPVIHGAHCLDLFSGSGALGLEALSRGAAEVIFVDQSSIIIKYLQAQFTLLSAENAHVYRAEIPTSNFPIQKKFNIVFLDPPFKQNLIYPSCQWLEEMQLLTPEALVYIEAEANLAPLPIPANWKILHSKKAGQVGYHLVQA